MLRRQRASADALMEVPTALLARGPRIALAGVAVVAAMLWTLVDPRLALLSAVFVLGWSQLVGL